jgi:NadR type nicotinamide-nucleotide adenylyltransferase
MTVGLTLGKFAPLHKGHQALIEKGIAETEQFKVLIYHAPEETRIPLSVRADWIRTIYPGIEVLEAWDGPTVMGDTPEIRSIQEEYILRILGDRRITHFYSSEFYGDHVSKALGAIDRRIDPDRSRISVSGTAIRSDVFGTRHHVDPRVYRDLITWVVFLGAPSTGKTSLCRELSKRYETVWMPEYGREYWDTHQQDRTLTQEQLLEIAIGHRAKEEDLVQNAKGFLFVDTDATTTRRFSQYYHGASLTELDALADAARSRYDLFFLCDDDIPYDDTWDRSGEANREVLQKQIRSDLLRRGTPHVTLRGTMDQRLTTVSHVLSHYEKWTSLPDGLLRRPGEQDAEIPST